MCQHTNNCFLSLLTVSHMSPAQLAGPAAEVPNVWLDVTVIVPLRTGQAACVL